MNADPGSTQVSNVLQNSLELCINLRFFHQAAVLEKTSEISKTQQKKFSLKNANCNHRYTFQSNFCASLIFGLQKIFFWPKMGPRNEPNSKMGAWWQNLSLVHISILFCGIFETYVDPRSAFVQKVKFSIGLENMGKNWSQISLCGVCLGDKESFADCIVFLTNSQ